MPEVLEVGREIQAQARAAAARIFNATVDEVLVTRNTTEGLNIVLSGLDWITSVMSRGGALLVDAPAGRAWEITAALAASDVYVSELTPSESSLEEYFLQVTGDESL